MEIQQVKIKNLKKSLTGMLLVLSKDKIQIYKMKYGEESAAKTLSVTGCIKDEGAALLACEFSNKTDIMVPSLSPTS